jgi:hypothetical protein
MYIKKYYCSQTYLFVCKRIQKGADPIFKLPKTHNGTTGVPLLNAIACARAEPAVCAQRTEMAFA